MTRTDPLPPGLYEQVLTDVLLRRLPEDRTRTEALTDKMADVLVEHVAAAVARALRAPGLNVGERVALCNQVLALIQEVGPSGAVVPGDLVAEPPRLLSGISYDRPGLAAPSLPRRPQTPLSEDSLFVNAPHEPALSSELRTEILSADGIDLLCAFVVWSGVRVVLNELREVRRRGVPVRVITTTYTGTTDPRALDELIEIGAEVKVSYDTRSTRLHAKAWLFERASGFSTAYIGSSNLTQTALHDGLEWNVRLSQIQSPDLLDRFRGAFEVYWADPHIVPYDRDRFRAAIKREQRTSSPDMALFDVRPYEYQRAMLDALRVERERHNRWRNLVVAATGTGKTVVAALDYRRMTELWGEASLLFVAHRHEILEQSRSLFRHVMRDGSFGEYLAAGVRPEDGQHVFASVQSLANIDLESIDPQAFDVVIVDEFHHAAAPTYSRWLNYLQPRLLLGLTATPERTDDADVLRWFEGRIAVELRLWEALDGGLLCPFQYFGVADGVDLSALEWKRSGYDIAQLNGLYTGNEVRTAKIIQAIHDLIEDTSAMRALAFCVSVEHAHYMTKRFRDAGIAAETLIGSTPVEERRTSVRRLRAREINVIVTVDVLNEGVDIPEIDTILLLRPTESATVFLQQLGRGLRLAEGKPGLTVLDFIGQQHRRFRFDGRLQALTGIPARRLEAAVKENFPHLPPGCYIHLDRVAAAVVLDNLRETVSARRPLLVRELRACGDVPLSRFLRESGRTLDDIYRTTGGWMNLRRAAGFHVPPELPEDNGLMAAISRMLHIDDPERLHRYRQWLDQDCPPELETLSERHIRLLHMLHFDLHSGGREKMSLARSLDELWDHEAVRAELREVLEVLDEGATSLVIWGGRDVEPLAVHERYTRMEVLAALGASTAEHPRAMREGVIWLPHTETDVFFVTLQKSERKFSSTTMYRDYAISPREFHWESQSTTSVATPTGQRYISQSRRGTRVLLFVRETSEERAFLFLGPARYVTHSGDRPIAITWRLEHEIPAEFFLAARAAG